MPEDVSSINSIPSASSSYGIDLTAQRFTFDWKTYIEDAKADRLPSNPYIDQGSVTQIGLYQGGQLTVEGYSQFATGELTTKQAFGDDKVVGIESQNLNVYDDEGILIQTHPSFDRSKVENLSTIFPRSYLDKMYASNPNGKRDYIPRLFWTGVDEFRTDGSGEETYYGGPCKISNGQIFVRRKYAGRGRGSVTFRDKNGKPILVDVDDPFTTCARWFEGDTTVRNRNLQARQFIYEMVYPNPQQCDELEDIFNYKSEGCFEYYRRINGARLTGVSYQGSRFLSVRTFYASYDDGGNPVFKSDREVTSFNWLGWVDPDMNGPRAFDNRPSVKANDGRSTYVY